VLRITRITPDCVCASSAQGSQCWDVPGSTWSYRFEWWSSVYSLTIS